MIGDDLPMRIEMAVDQMILTLAGQIAQRIADQHRVALELSAQNAEAKFQQELHERLAR